MTEMNWKRLKVKYLCISIVLAFVFTLCVVYWWNHHELASLSHRGSLVITKPWEFFSSDNTESMT